MLPSTILHQKPGPQWAFVPHADAEEIAQTLRDLRAIGLDVLTIGQYLQPTPQHLAIDRWVTPDEFREWKEYGLSLGIGVIESGPLVRSSYHADEQSARYTGAASLHTTATDA